MYRSLIAAIALLWFAGCSDEQSNSKSANGQAPGELTYQRFCISCHSSGASGAPPVGNAQVWAPRIAQGDVVLLKNTVEGMPSTGMPARGMCVGCTDQELLDAIHYMTIRSQ